jgi:hypothetical protein
MKSVFLFSIIALCLSFTYQKSNAWNLAKEKNNIKVYTRFRDGSKIKEFKAVANFNCTLAQVEKTLVNIKTMNQWYDKVEKVEMLQQISNNEAIYKIYFDFPAIVQDRYSTIKAIIKKDNIGNIFIKTSFFSVPHKEEKSRIYVKEIASEWSITGSDGNVTLEHIAFMNPAGFIPEWLVNSNLTDGPIRTLSNLKALVVK